jgi:hypothetical protein
MSEHSPFVRATVALLLLLGVVVFVVRAVRPPDVAPASSPPNTFSAARASAHIARLTSAPRPPGTQGHEDARAFILAELGRLGIPAEVQRASVLSTRWGVPYDAARVENIVARLHGTGSGKAIALVAHYDSVPNAPGAGDDASGVATLLETARALREGGPPLQNDVIFLFTDAEEAGVLGGRAFVAEHPSFRDIALAINFDARGAGGPVALVETSPDSGLLVRELASAAPHPIASSLFPEVTRRLGHETDLRPFLLAGVPGLNFVFADAPSHYHAPSDDLDNLDLRSNQHAGGYALALVQRFGDQDLARTRAPDAVYFNLLGGPLVVYPRSWALPLAFALTALFAVVARAAIRAQRARPARILAAAGALTAPLVLAPAAAFGLVLALRRLFPVLGAMRGDPHDPGLFRIALVVFALGVAAAAYRFFRARLSAEEVATGGALLWLWLCAATSLLLPSASYVFTWPLLFNLLGLFVALRRPSASPLPVVALAAAGAGALAIAAPLPYLFFVALGLPRAAPAVALVVLIALLLAPQMEHLGLARSPRPALGLLSAAALAFIFALAMGRFSPSAPRPTSLAYMLDSASGAGAWLTTEENLDAWTAAYFPDDRATAPSFALPGQGTLTRQSPAPPLDLAPPRLELLADTTQEGRRTLRMRLVSPRGAPFALVWVASGAEILGAVVDGRRVDENGGFRSTAAEPWGFSFNGLPAGGIEWSIEVRPGAPGALRVVDRSYALPASLLRAPRPPDRMPMPFRIADSTFVAADFRY